MKYVILVLSLGLFSCSSTKTIYVAENLSDQNTLLVRENSNEDWVSLENGIDGFEHQPGVLQKIEVSVDPKNNYQLKKVLFQEIKEPKNKAPKGNWIVTHITDVESLATQPTLNLNDGKINGNAGCNNYSANYIINKSEISIAPAMATKMSCQNMAIEKAFFNCLKEAKFYKIEDGKLMLLNQNNAVLMTCKTE